jgi:hypothetical protein
MLRARRIAWIGRRSSRRYDRLHLARAKQMLARAGVDK